VDRHVDGAFDCSSVARTAMDRQYRFLEAK